jgi:hypothetical protein
MTQEHKDTRNTGGDADDDTQGDSLAPEELDLDGLEPPRRIQPSSDMGFILVLALGLTLIFFLHQIIRAVANVGAPDEHVYLGVVKKVSYIGGVRTATQVDTDSRTLLLRGAANVKLGVSLERRKGSWDTEVCEQQTSNCWTLESQ